MRNLTLLLIYLFIVGCAAHTLQHDQQVEKLLNSWLNTPIEKFLDKNPDVENPIPIGNDSFRYTLIHNIHTDAEALASMSGPRHGRDDFYHLYIFVKDGIIYKVDYSRKTRTW